MKILLVNSFDIHGGAARAAYRLHKYLLAQNIDCQILVQNKISSDHTVIEIFSSLKKEFDKLRKTLDNIPVVFYKKRTKTLFSPSWLPSGNIVVKINQINPDIVHLHWINRGMIKIEDLAKIKAPIVWSLHDMWAFTGGCHYDDECGAYESVCGNCKVLGSDKDKDLSWRIFSRKEKTFQKIQNITIIGLSKWLEDCAKKSTLFKNKNVINLPNPIDCDNFKPLNKDVSRALWNLPKGKKLLLFGAMNAISDPRKGFNELINAFTKLKIKNVELVIYGAIKPEKSQNFAFKTHYLGELHDDVSLVTLYSAVDVMIVPSLQENLSNSILESMACGTPVVGFDIGGNADMVEQKKTGYLAKQFDIDDLANGIDWVLNTPSYKKLCHNARNKVLKQFDSKVVVQQYIELYKSLLQ